MLSTNSSEDQYNLGLKLLDKQESTESRENRSAAALFLQAAKNKPFTYSPITL